MNVVICLCNFLIVWNLDFSDLDEAHDFGFQK